MFVLLICIGTKVFHATLSFHPEEEYKKTVCVCERDFMNYKHIRIESIIKFDDNLPMDLDCTLCTVSKVLSMNVEDLRIGFPHHFHVSLEEHLSMPSVDRIVFVLCLILTWYIY
jgi:hypothetical protein